MVSTVKDILRIPSANAVGSVVSKEAKPLVTNRLGAKLYDLTTDSLPPSRKLNYEPSHGFIETENKTALHVIQVKALGPEVKKDTAVLFVPGFWSTATMNFPAMKELAAQGINSFAFSQEGHGRSKDNNQSKTEASLNSPKINFSLTRYLKNLETVIKSLEASGITKIHLVGHSFGGYLVQKYLASKSSANIASATLLASVPPAGMLMANLRFALQSPWDFIKANITFNATTAMKNERVAAKVLFSTTPENVPKGCKLSPESFLANVQAMMPINPEQVKASGVPITVVGTKNDFTISKNEVERTAFVYNVQEKLIDGPHMWMADSLARKQFINLLAEVVKNPDLALN